MAKLGTDLETVRAVVARLPGCEESTSYGTPAFRVRGKLFARLHQNGESLVILIRADFEEREALLRAHPRSFFVTDHYRGHPWVLARLAATPRGLLGEALEQAWRLTAPRRLVDKFDGSLHA